MPKSIVALLLCSLIVALAGCAKSKDHEPIQTAANDAKKDQGADKTTPTSTTITNTTTTMTTTTSTTTTMAVSQNSSAASGSVPTVTVPQAKAPAAVVAPAVPSVSEQPPIVAPPKKEVPASVIKVEKAQPPVPVEAKPLAPVEVKPAASPASQIHEGLETALAGAMTGMAGALDVVSQVAQDGLKPTTFGFPDDKMYPDVELTKETRALKYPAKGITAIEIKSRLLGSVKISQSGTDQITIGFVAKADPDMKPRARLLAEGIKPSVVGSNLVLSDVIPQNQCVQMVVDSSFSMRGSCVTEIAIGLPANSSIKVLDDKGKAIVSKAKASKPRTFSNPCEQELSVFENVPSFAKLCSSLKTKANAATFKTCVIKQARRFDPELSDEEVTSESEDVLLGLFGLCSGGAY